MKIAISGLSGVGTSSSSKQVAAILGLPMSNFTFRALAQERGIPWEELQIAAASDLSIDLELDRRLIEFIQSNESCLVSSDLAIWLGNPKLYKRLGLERGADFDLTIWLEASLEERSRRMAIREQRSLEEVMTQDDKRDHDNRERFQRLYGIDLFDHRHVDWEINTEDRGLEEVVALIVKRCKELQQRLSGSAQ